MEPYWCGELWRSYGSAGTAELHSTPQIKVADFYWRHLRDNRRVKDAFITAVTDIYRDNCLFKNKINSPGRCIHRGCFPA